MQRELQPYGESIWYVLHFFAHLSMHSFLQNYGMQIIKKNKKHGLEFAKKYSSKLWNKKYYNKKWFNMNKNYSMIK